MSSEVKFLIERCWAGDADRRPSFSDIRKDLERMEFKILPDVDAAAVKRFADDIRGQEGEQ
jgi:hypothetical protein